MSAAVTFSSHETGFELCFESLFGHGRGFAFPCDSQGRIDFDAVSDRARNNYLFARAMIGREYAVPIVRRSGSP